MKIDGNELAILQNELDQQGFKDETTAPARRPAAITATASNA